MDLLGRETYRERRVSARTLEAVETRDDYQRNEWNSLGSTKGEKLLLRVDPAEIVPHSVCSRLPL